MRHGKKGAIGPVITMSMASIRLVWHGGSNGDPKRGITFRSSETSDSFVLGNLNGWCRGGREMHKKRL